MGYDGRKEGRCFVCTGTPKLAQYLVFEVYENKVVFYIRNTGDLEVDFLTRNTLRNIIYVKYFFFY